PSKQAGNWQESGKKRLGIRNNGLARQQAGIARWRAPGIGISADLPALAVGPIWGRQADRSGLMSAVERLEQLNGEAAPAEASTIEAVLAEQPGKNARLRPLLALAPYVARYRWRAILALISLTVAAITTLVVPIAVRRMIDFGFTPTGIAMINSYFSVMVAVVAVLALASASRYYLVMTIGERIVADLRRDVFAHLISLSPAF